MTDTQNQLPTSLTGSVFGKQESWESSIHWKFFEGKQLDNAHLLDQGYIPLCSAEIRLPKVTHAKLIEMQVAALKKEKTRIQADTEIAVQYFDTRIQNLLAITDKG